MTKQEIKALQQGLKAKGLDLGKSGADGIMGPKTKAALAKAAETNPKLREQYSEFIDKKPIVKSGDSNIRDIQTKLKNAGYDLGKGGVDGIMGPATRAAMQEYEKKSMIPRPRGIGLMNTANRDATSTSKPSVIEMGKSETPLQTSARLHQPQPRPTSGILRQARTEKQMQFDKKANESQGLRSTVRDFFARNLPGSYGKSGALMASDWVNNENTITSNSMSEKAMNFLQDQAERLGPGRHVLGGNYKKIYGSGVSDLDIMSPGAREVATKLGQYVADVDDDLGVRIEDRYNFNASDEDSSISNENAPTSAEVNAIQTLPLGQRVIATGILMGRQKKAYDKVRYGIAPAWNSKNDEGAQVRISVPPKNNKGKP